MAGSGIEEITDGIWCWVRRPQGLRTGEFGGRTSYAVAVDGATLLIDPLVHGEEDPALVALDELARGSVRILVTMPYHTRSAEMLWRHYRHTDPRIYGHAAVATRLADTSGFVALSPGDEVDGFARFHAISIPPRSEQAIEIPSHHALVFGDTIVNIGHELRVWGASLDSEQRRRRWRERILPALTPLAALEPDHVLVTHGDPVVGDGAAALRHALEHDTWQRTKR